MHEMALSESILGIIEDEARSRGFAKVLGVRLELGVLSCVEPEALRFCFAAVSRGTVADGARVEILPKAARAWCWDCECAVEVGDLLAVCPSCGGQRLKVESGDQLRVKDLEVA
jgi:hydrogenase nickel incorporation protein HypA/HybF